MLLRVNWSKVIVKLYWAPTPTLSGREGTRQEMEETDWTEQFYWKGRKVKANYNIHKDLAYCICIYILRCRGNRRDITAIRSRFGV